MKNNEYRVNLVNKYVSQLNLSEDIKNYYLGRNILVTGGAGAIGSNLVIALSELVGAKGIIIVLRKFDFRNIISTLVMWTTSKAL